MTQRMKKFARRPRQLAMLAVLCGPWLLGGCASTPAPVVAVAPPAPLAPPATMNTYIAEASQRFNVPEQWIRAVMAQESGGRTHVNGQPIVSPKGAMGLMQVMPSTWAALRNTYKLGNDPFEPHDNIMAGTAYIREMFDQYGSPGFLAAYNAGPGRYQTHLRTHRPLPGETRHYVAVIAPKIGGIYPIGPSPARIAAANNTQVAALPTPAPAPTPTLAATPELPVAETATAKPEATHAAAPAPVTPAPVQVAAIPAATPSAPVVEPRPMVAAASKTHLIEAEAPESDEPASAPPPKKAQSQQAASAPRPALQLARADAHPDSNHRQTADVPHPQRRPTLPPGWYVPTPYTR